MVKIHKKIKLNNPQLVAAWPGMGEVALGVASYLREVLRTEEFGLIDAPHFFQATGIHIEDNLIEIPKSPRGRFYYWRNEGGGSDLMIFIGEAQPNLEKGKEYAHEVLDVVESLKVRRIYTSAAMPISIDHLQKPKVWGAVTHKRLLKELSQYGVRPMSSGQISGLNGLLLGVAKERGMEGMCLLGEIPFYTLQIENPKSSMAVLNVLTKMLDIEINMDKLKGHAKHIEEEIGKLVNYLKGSASTEPIGDEEIRKLKKILAAYTKLPESAKRSIEQLFKEVQKDISKASELKRELDKWGVYNDYEDRFLDLFKKRKKEG